MALIKCTECGKEISDTISTCIHCGYKIKNTNKSNETKEEIIIEASEAKTILNDNEINQEKNENNRDNRNIITLNIFIITVLILIFLAINNYKKILLVLITLAISIFLIKVIIKKLKKIKQEQKDIKTIYLKIFAIPMIVFISLLITLVEIIKDNRKDYLNSFKKARYEYGSYILEDIGLKTEYDDNGNLIHFDDEENNNIDYSYEYNEENQIEQIDFSGINSGIKMEGYIKFLYNDNKDIQDIMIYREMLSDVSVDNYEFFYDTENKPHTIQHTKDNKNVGDCKIYDYEQYILTDCNTENKKYSTIYAPDETLKNENVWIANNIRPFALYDVAFAFPSKINGDMSLFGSDYMVPYNPGKLLYDKLEQTNSGDTTKEFKVYYSNNNAIKAELISNYETTLYSIYDDNKIISSIDSTNINIESTYSYKDNTITQKNNKKDDEEYLKLKKKYQNYFEEQPKDYEIDKIIINLEKILKEKYNEIFAPAPIIETSTDDIVELTNTMYYSVKINTKYTDRISILLNNEPIYPYDDHCDKIDFGIYLCSNLKLREGENKIFIKAENDEGKTTDKEIAINVNIPAPYVKFEQDYYSLPSYNPHWSPQFTLSDSAGYYKINIYIDDYKLSEKDLRDLGNNTYNAWIGDLVIGTRPVSGKNHVLKMTIEDKRTGKIAETTSIVDIEE